MTTYEFVEGTLKHADELVKVMRKTDVDELWNFAKLTPPKAMTGLVAGSRDTITVLADGEILFMYGSVRQNALSGTGYPWLVATPKIKEHSKLFLRHVKKFLNEILKQYDVLENYGDSRDQESVRWMTWLGFKITGTELLGTDQIPFHRYELTRTVEWQK
jgi:hypothetical protein|tara:strand:+ start:11349 stop:11828 length:480 start_codon:yes stop_codon:yes gene_type:complete